MRTHHALIAAAALALPLGLAEAQPGTQSAQSRNYTYQGRLLLDGSPAGGPFDFEVAQYDTDTGGTPLAVSTHLGITVDEGLFTIPDVEPGPFDLGTKQMWIEIRFRPPGGGSFIPLPARQPLGATPVATTLRGFEARQFTDGDFGGFIASKSPSGKVALSLGAAQSDNAGFLSLFDGNANITLAELTVENSDNARFGSLTLNGQAGTGGGNIVLRRDSGITALDLTGGSATTGPVLNLYAPGAGTLSPTLRLDAHDDGGALLELWDDTTGLRTLTLDGRSQSAGSLLGMYNAAGKATVFLDSDFQGGGVLSLAADDGSVRLFFDAQSSDQAGFLSVRNSEGEETIAIDGDDRDDAGFLDLRNRAGSTNFSGVTLDALDDDDAGGRVTVFNDKGAPVIELDGDRQRGATLLVRHDNGNPAFQVFENLLTMYDQNGAPTIAFVGATGAKNGVVHTESQGDTFLYAVEATEVWFEDVGSARLTNGSTTIALDPLFLETVTVSPEHPIRVFITPTAPCNGLWVEKHDTGFTVHELMQGSSNASFDYRVMAKRRGLESARLEPFTAPR